MNWLDKRVLWDLIKYKIRQRTITFSKGQARKRGAKLQKVEDKLLSPSLKRKERQKVGDELASNISCKS